MGPEQGEALVRAAATLEVEQQPALGLLLARVLDQLAPVVAQRGKPLALGRGQLVELILESARSTER